MNILKQIKSSGLNFVLQETPFSVYMTRRKTFCSDSLKIQASNYTPNYDHSSTSTLEENIKTLENENRSLEKAFKQKEAQLAEAIQTLMLLETKLDKAEVEVFKQSNHFKVSKDVLKDEILLLKKSLKEQNEENKQNHSKLSDFTKTIKSKDKEIHNLFKRVEHFQDKTKNLKELNQKLQNEKAKLEKSHKKTKQENRPNRTDSNSNNLATNSNSLSTISNTSLTTSNRPNTITPNSLVLSSAITNSSSTNVKNLEPLATMAQSLSSVNIKDQFSASAVPPGSPRTPPGSPPH